jgi:hypothetical protein
VAAGALGVATAAAMTGGVARAADDPPGLAVVSVNLAASLERQRPAIEGALARGLEVAELPVTAPGLARERLRGREALLPCAAESCLLEIARSVGTPFLVYAEVATARRFYSVQLRLIDSTDGRVLASEAVECRATDPCPPVPEQLAELARELGRKGGKEIRHLQAGRSGPAVEPVGAGEPTAPAPSPPPPMPASAPEPRPPRLFAWGLVGSGVVLLGTSAVLFAQDGAATDCMPARDGTRVCRGTRQTRTPALVVGGAGLLAAGVGVALLLTSRNDDPAYRISVGPGGLALHGRF